MFWGPKRISQHDSVETDLDLGDVSNAISDAFFHLRFFNAARGVGYVRMPGTDSSAEQFHAAAGAGAFHNGGAKRGGDAEFFGHGRGEGENRGRSDNADLVTRLCRYGYKPGQRGNKNESSFHDGYHT